MTSSVLNATSFVYSQIRRDSYFESILAICVVIYNDIISSAIKLVYDENLIRDVFLNYLQNAQFKRKYDLHHLKFDKETVENKGRADIRVLPTMAEYIDDDEYYLIECKRLGYSNSHSTSASELNTEYVKNGICRFVSGYYSSHYDCNAMFGFLVSRVCVQTDIIDDINTKLNKDYINAQKRKVNANAKKQLTYENFANGYLYSYISTHTHAYGKDLALYHLIFDFS
jgi:hypothetical protein